MLYSFAMFFYILGFLLMFTHFFVNRRTLEKIANTSFALGVLCQAIFVSVNWSNGDTIYTSSLFGVLSLLMFFIILSYLIIYVFYKRPFLSLLVAPLGIASGVFGMLGTSIVHQKEYLSKFWIYIHLPLTIGGSAFFLLSAIVGVLYFIQEKQIKNKNFGLIFKNFPSLDTINKLNSSTIIIGFVLFSGGVISGIIWGVIEWGGRLILTPKLTFAFTTWVIFGIILLTKETMGMTPKKLAVWSIAGILLILLTYHGVARFLMGN